MKRILFISHFFLLNFFPSNNIAAQKSAKILLELSSDTVGLNSQVEVAVIVENANVKRLNPPKFDGFEVHGPSTSTSMSIINGDMTQSSTYIFYLTPLKKGIFKIDPASIETEGGILKTEEHNIVVLENFDLSNQPLKLRQSIWGDADSFFGRPVPSPRTQEKPKKKYETEKL